MEPVPSGSERRIAKRHKVDLSVMVEFVHPQSTIAPQTVKRPINETTGQLWYLHGGMTTLTEQGASVCITNISQQRYFRLIRDQTYKHIRLECKFPGDERAARLFGVLCWSEYRSSPEKQFHFGMMFHDLVPEDQERIARFLASLVQSSENI